MTLTILYGSQSGTAERQAFRISRMALQHGAGAVRCLPADDTAVAEWPGYCRDGGHVVFVLANANQGEAPESYRRSWAQLLSRGAPSMEHLSYAVFGLGDSLYAKFNYMAKMTHNRLRQLGGQPLLLRGLGDESDAKGLDEALLPWLSELWAALGLAPTAESPQAPLDAKLFPLWHVAVGALACGDADRAEEATRAGTDARTVAADRVPRTERSTFPCTVTANRRLTAADHFQAVHHIDFDVDTTATYEVGDALGVYVPNPTELVDYMLDFCQLRGEQTITITPNAGDGLVEQTRRPFFGMPITARQFFTYYVDLEAVTEQDFFWMMSFFAKGVTAEAVARPSDGGPSLEEEYRDRLRELANPTNPDDFLVYSYREKRNVGEVLLDYNVSHDIKVRPPLAYVLSFLTPMRPRLFSLSSSPALDPLPRIALTVAQLDWKTPMQRHRHGMCSTALAQAQPGDRFQCFFWEGTLTLPPAPTPLLLVATGSGIAPMRALIRHCAAFSAQGWRDVPILLFFGCRHASKDFLYADEWAAFHADGLLRGLTVVPAFSREDPSTKVYVQHKLGQHATRVGALLWPGGPGHSQEEDAVADEPHAQAVVYVCGNAKNMPKDVQAVLQDIIDQTCCGGDEDLGRQFMKRMQQEGRYQVDTWSA